MNLRKCILTKNNCYKTGEKQTVRGIMVHSTGANNPRYVQPDDGLLGQNNNGNHWNQPKPGGRSVCVHAFIGKLENGSIATYQTLPWDMQGWHAGGSANNGYIGFEICEDNLKDQSYFSKVYQEAVELCAYLCKTYGLNPDKDILCHSEGAKLGIASNHADVMHWFPMFGKNMDDFRGDVRNELEGDEEEMTQEQFNQMFENAMRAYNQKIESMPVSDWAKESWEKQVAAGIFDGTKPCAPMTREQAATVITRLENVN